MHHVQRPAPAVIYANGTNDSGKHSNGGIHQKVTGNSVVCQRRNVNNVIDREDICDGNGNAIFQMSMLADNSAWLNDRSLTREVFGVINGRLGKTSTIEGDSIQTVFNDMHLYPTPSQVSEMLQCAKNCSRRKGAYLTIGEICFYVRELRRSKICKRTKQIGTKYTECTSNCEVFLGGSCNPTTWRTDTAIPELKKHGITYYNPQVSMWAPELVAKEHNAKQAASLLLFVVDSETRSVAGMIEVAFLVAGGRCVVLVANSYRAGQTIMGEYITNREYHDLVNGQTSLLALVKSHGIKVHNNLSTALQCTANILRNSSDLNITAQERVHMKLNELREVFDEHDRNGTGELNLHDTLSAYHKLTGVLIEEPRLYEYLNITSYNSNNSTSNGLWNLRTNNRNGELLGIRVSFEQFCALVAEFHDDASNNNSRSNGNLKNERATKSIRDAVNTAHRNNKNSTQQNGRIGNINNSSSNINNNSSSAYSDIYLGGSCSTNSTWRQNIAIPLIRRHNLIYYNPASEINALDLIINCDDSNLDLNGSLVCEASVLSWKRALEQSRVLVFVVGSDRRALTTMILAAYYIGLGRDVVLCIEQLPTNEEMRIDDDVLSKQATKDYNRGRVYLSDIAKRKQVPVFDNVSAAIESAISRCPNSTTSSR